MQLSRFFSDSGKEGINRNVFKRKCQLYMEMEIFIKDYDMVVLLYSLRP